MDQTPSLDLAPALPAAPPEVLPWEADGGDAEAAPVRRLPPRKTARSLARPAAPERLHWPVIALTTITALTLVFGTHGGNQVRTWEFSTPVSQAR